MILIGHDGRTDGRTDNPEFGVKFLKQKIANLCILLQGQVFGLILPTHNDHICLFYDLYRC
jgi:hypothetical protein